MLSFGDCRFDSIRTLRTPTSLRVISVWCSLMVSSFFPTERPSTTLSFARHHSETPPAGVHHSEANSTRSNLCGLQCTGRVGPGGHGHPIPMVRCDDDDDDDKDDDDVVLHSESRPLSCLIRPVDGNERFGLKDPLVRGILQEYLVSTGMAKSESYGRYRFIPCVLHSLVPEIHTNPQFTCHSLLSSPTLLRPAVN